MTVEVTPPGQLPCPTDGNNTRRFDAATWGSAIAGPLVPLIGYRILFGNSRE
ncbi:hypothetical protein [Streptomyces sp. NBC_00286]|uniref:hypothetical protein n=1 Tax=Streptomyces sp. NBC_00286 TaxID=2975701 RepID=UPI003FA7ACAF